MIGQKTELEVESIDYFVSFAQILGLPKSIGQIYGLLFVSPDPLAMDDFVEKLEISKGSASQGLGTLKELGAILPVRMEGDRREHYRADFDVSRIVNHFFDDRLGPRLEHGEERLKRLVELAESDGGNLSGESLLRLKALQKWQKRGRQAIPLVKRFLKN